MSALPGLGGRPYEPIVGERFQEVANRTAHVVFRLLDAIHSAESKTSRFPGTGDAGPIISGCLGGLIQFASLGHLSDTELRAKFIEIFDTVLPQMRMERAARGTAERGHA